jgi:hypothetical protein
MTYKDENMCPENQDTKPSSAATEIQPVDVAKIDTNQLYDFQMDIKQLLHLLQAWAYVEIYQHAPFVEAYHDENNNYIYKKIPVQGGLTIYDYGNALAITRTEQWDKGDMTTGKMLKSIQEMVDILAKRHQQTAPKQEMKLLISSYDQIAKRAVWIAAKAAGITVENFSPTVDDVMVESRINSIKTMNLPTLTNK